MENRYKIIRGLIEKAAEKHGSMNRFAQKAGVVQSFISELYLGKAKRPGIERLEKVSVALGKDKYFLENLFYNRQKKEEFQYPPGTMPVSEMKNWQKRPIFDANCGDIQMYLSHGKYPTGFSDEFEFIQTDDPNSFLVRANGDAMVGDDIKDGDLLLVEPNKPVNQGNICFCFIKDQGMTVKRFYEYGDTVVLRPTNEKYEEIKFSKAENETTRINYYPVTSITRKTY